ncbi:SAM-dependent methyltransferase [Streptomyces boncukensis]|uniref:Methyltransferase domain-containing protein n=1 Tax=Streptomyces boncukensis TaxID=2711219 RepID=A0A6G4WVP5_9ACTN|nr:methyltransferase domain-containing protein [Streptomyces boncukensis]NGO68922.1 methyltransferase domain-containing protein [Streptomyces boncukensis]
MTSASAVPPTDGRVTDYYSALGPLIQLAWGDNLHFGYWEGPQDRSSPQEATDRFTDLLAGRLRVGPGDRVLDAGCGVGRPALRVASSTGAAVLGVTISEQQVRQATELAEAAQMSGQVSFAYADAMDLPFESGSFDAVLAFESIVHMDRPKALREMARVLAPGGRLVLTDTFPVGGGTEPPDGGASDTGNAGNAGNTGNAGSVASLGRIEDYPGLVAGAGLRLDELTDVSEHTKFTFIRVLERIFRSRKEFERQHGVSVEEVFESLKSAHPQASVDGTAEVGCLIMAAHKP